MTEVTPEKIDELVGGKVQEHEVHAHAHSHSHGGAPCTGHGHGEQVRLPSSLDPRARLVRA
jgi:hypothetical protein